MATPTGLFSLCLHLSVVKRKFRVHARDRKTIDKKLLLAVDHSARQSMKNAANCENQCELQDTTSISILNAHCGHRFLTWPHLSEGLLTSKPIGASSSLGRSYLRVSQLQDSSRKLRPFQCRVGPSARLRTLCGLAYGRQYLRLTGPGKFPR